MNLQLNKNTTMIYFFNRNLHISSRECGDRPFFVGTGPSREMQRRKGIRERMPCQRCARRAAPAFPDRRRLPEKEKDIPVGDVSFSVKKKSRRRPTLARASPALPSAKEPLTSVFGMGTGVTTPLWPPAKSRKLDAKENRNISSANRISH